MLLRFSLEVPILKKILVYDQYYASLAAASAGPSAQATPTATGVGSSSSGSPSFSMPQVNDDDDEEDKKPNVEYLDSLNAYRKRSRSQEDVGAASKLKAAKIDIGLSNGNGYLGVNGHANGNGNGYANGYGMVNGHGGELQDVIMTQLGDEGSAEFAEPADDPVVYGSLSLALSWCAILTAG